MTLDILIPTYNRSKFLIKNLEQLSIIISRFPSENIGIIISDNASTDETGKAVEEFIQNNPSVKIRYHRQKENIGFTRNFISVLSLSKADYILTLGDDDYIDERYLKEAIESIKKNPDITAILPAFNAIDEEGNELGWGRDLGQTRRLFLPSVESVKLNAGRAHQVSGIILKGEGLEEALKEEGINNLYPQIFITAYSCLKGKCLHIPEYPVAVTQTNNKAWRYDDVGLLIDIFQNFNALHLSPSEQYSLEHEMIKTQRWRAFRYFKNPLRQMRVIFQIAFSKNTSNVGKFLLPPYLTYLWMRFLSNAVKIKLKRWLR